MKQSNRWNPQFPIPDRPAPESTSSSSSSSSSFQPPAPQQQLSGAGGRDRPPHLPRRQRANSVASSVASSDSATSSSASASTSTSSSTESWVIAHRTRSQMTATDPPAFSLSSHLTTTPPCKRRRGESFNTNQTDGTSPRETFGSASSPPCPPPKKKNRWVPKPTGPLGSSCTSSSASVPTSQPRHPSAQYSSSSSSSSSVGLVAENVKAEAMELTNHQDSPLVRRQPIAASTTPSQSVLPPYAVPQGLWFGPDLSRADQAAATEFWARYGLRRMAGSSAHRKQYRQMTVLYNPQGFGIARRIQLKAPSKASSSSLSSSSKSSSASASVPASEPEIRDYEHIRECVLGDAHYLPSMLLDRLKIFDPEERVAAMFQYSALDLRRAKFDAIDVPVDINVMQLWPKVQNLNLVPCNEVADPIRRCISAAYLQKAHPTSTTTPRKCEIDTTEFPEAPKKIIHRPFEKASPVRLEVRTSTKLQGQLGCFVKQAVRKKTFIGEYVGELIDEPEFYRRARLCDSVIHRNYALEMEIEGHRVFVDALFKGNELRFVNHRINKEDQNCVFETYFYAGKYRVAIYSTQKIAPDSELWIDYGRSYYGLRGTLVRKIDTIPRTPQENLFLFKFIVIRPDEDQFPIYHFLPFWLAFCVRTFTEEKHHSAYHDMLDVVYLDLDRTYPHRANSLPGVDRYVFKPGVQAVSATDAVWSGMDVQVHFDPKTQGWMLDHQERKRIAQKILYNPARMPECAGARTVLHQWAEVD